MHLAALFYKAQIRQRKLSPLSYYHRTIDENQKASWFFVLCYRQKWLTFTIFVTITIFTEKVHTDFKWAKEIQWRLESWYWRSSKAVCYQFWTSTWLVALFVAAQIDPKTHCDFWRSEIESCVTVNAHHQPIRDKQSGGLPLTAKYNCHAV